MYCMGLCIKMWYFNDDLKLIENKVLKLNIEVKGWIWIKNIHCKNGKGAKITYSCCLVSKVAKLKSI